MDDVRLATLPLELVALIFARLSPLDAAALHATCRALRSATADADAWSAQLLGVGVSPARLAEMCAAHALYPSFARLLNVPRTWFRGDIVLRRTGTLHQRAARGITLADGGAACLTAGADHSVAEWDYRSGAVVARYLTPASAIMALATPNRVIACGFDSRLFAFERGASEPPVIELATGQGDDVFHIGWMAHGSSVFGVGDYGHCGLLDLEMGRPISNHRLCESMLWSAALLPLGALVIGSDADGVFLFDPRTDTTPSQRAATRGDVTIVTPMDEHTVVHNEQHDVVLRDTRKFGVPRARVPQFTMNLPWGLLVDDYKLVATTCAGEVAIAQFDPRTDGVVPRVRVRDFPQRIYGVIQPSDTTLLLCEWSQSIPMLEFIPPKERATGSGVRGARPVPAAATQMSSSARRPPPCRAVRYSSLPEREWDWKVSDR